MLKVAKDYPLKNLNAFKVDVKTKFFAEVKSLADLEY